MFSDFTSAQTPNLDHPCLNEEDGDDWGEFEQPDVKVTASGLAQTSEDVFKPGQSLLYKTKDGQWVTAKLITIDRSISPPSYAIEVDGNSRETEAWRLKPAHEVDSNSLIGDHQEIFTPKSNGFAAHTNGNVAEDDGFGDFEAATTLDIPTATAVIKDEPKAGLASIPLPEDMFAEVVPIPETQPIELETKTTRQSTPQLETVEIIAVQETNTSDAEETIEDDGFGDFEAAEAMQQIVPPNIAVEKEEADQHSTPSPIPQAAGFPFANDDFDDNEDDFGDFASSSIPPSEPAPPLVMMTPTYQLPDQKKEDPIFKSLGTHTVAQSTSEYAEYAVVWTRMLQAISRELSHAQQLWRGAISSSNDDMLQAISRELSHARQLWPGAISSSNDDVYQALIQHPQVQIYLTALGKMYFVAQLIRITAEQHGLLQFVGELATAWQDCSAQLALSDDHDVGSSTAKSKSTLLEQGIKEASRNMNQPVDELLSLVQYIQTTLPTLSQDEFPRLLTWTEGLEGVTLLPLSLFSSTESSPGVGIQQQQWAKARPTLCVIARVWSRCVDINQLPDLD